VIVARQRRAFEFPFSTRDVFTARLGLPDSPSPDDAALNTRLSDARRGVGNVPGVRAVALA
jgi:hypothetical protein